MITLTTPTIQEKNALFSDEVWLYLLTLTNKDETVVIRICNNPEPITFKGNEFTPFPFMLEEVTQSSKGELPTVNLILSNVERIVQAYVEQDDTYGSGWTVNIDITYKTAIDNNVSEISLEFTTMNVNADESKVTFLCGINNPIRSQFPRVRMLANACQNTFKKGGCTYSGSDTTCSKTREACNLKFPSATKIPFLGFPAIPTSGIYQ